MKNTIIIFSLIILFSVSCSKSSKIFSGKKDPYVRIALIHKANKVTISSDGDYVISSYNGKKKVKSSDKVNMFIGKDNPSVYLNNNMRIKALYYPIKFKPIKNYIKVNNVPFRGEIHIIKDADNYLLIVNYLPIEEYLKGVVPAEIGRLDIELIEALKAQAIAARTYTISHLKKRYDMGYDMECTIADQVYKGVFAEYHITNIAIKETKGIVALYNGIPIDAKYHSTCGGHTSDNENAWGGDPVPYLRGVYDGGGCLFNRYHYCDDSKHYNWKHVFKRSDFFTLVNRNISNMKGKTIKIKKIYVKKRDNNGRVNLLIAVDTNGKHWNLTGLDIRRIFRGVNAPGNFLRSRYFKIIFRFNTITIEGKGFGHGVGMCQYGAMDMARKGKKYDAILKHYYRGIELKKLY